MHQLITWQVNDPFVHYMIEELRRRPGSDKPMNLPVGSTPPQPWNIGQLNEKGIYHPWGGHPLQQPGDQDPFNYNVGLQDPGIRRSDDWDFPIGTNNLTRYHFFPNVGTLGQIHRGTPWQTIYLKSVYFRDPNTGQLALLADPTLWWNWSGSIGGYPSRDWALLDVFTSAPNENAARGLLAVNQTNRAAWSAVLSGITVPTNTSRIRDLQLLGPDEFVDPDTGYTGTIIEPGGMQISNIVQSINDARTNQFEVILNPNRNANPQQVYIAIFRTNSLVQKPVSVFEHMGDVLGAPALTVQSPYLNRHALQVRHVWNDRAVEYIPQQILSLLKRDEPRFVVYAFGQSLKPAPRSLTSDPNYYHMCTNYQITGEVITKTTFRVEGEAMNARNPLRAVVESYQILPPAE
jgi:hypothetical protein